MFTSLIPELPWSFLFIQDLIGTIVFAISGAIAARQHKMDIFGMFILAFIVISNLVAKFIKKTEQSLNLHTAKIAPALPMTIFYESTERSVGEVFLTPFTLVGDMVK